MIVGVHATAAVLAGFVVLGMGNGMTTLARATAVADLYGHRDYGTIGSVAALLTTSARAAGPVAAALCAGAVGYGALLWTFAVLAAAAVPLAYRAERAHTTTPSSAWA